MTEGEIGTEWVKLNKHGSKYSQCTVCAGGYGLQIPEAYGTKLVREILIQSLITGFFSGAFSLISRSSPANDSKLAIDSEMRLKALTEAGKWTFLCVCDDLFLSESNDILNLTCTPYL